MITKTTEIRLTKPTIQLNDRRKSDEHYRQYSYGRRDIAMVQFQGIANVFFGVNGLEQVDLYESIFADSEGKQQIETEAQKLYNATVTIDYIEEHKQFFASLNKKD